jgi:hypothetical protein
LASDVGEKVHVSGKGTAGANHFRCSASAPHSHVLWSDACFGREDGFVEPSVKRKTITEITGVELHGQVCVPILETARDEALGTVEVLKDVFVAV